MGELFGFDATASYSVRMAALAAAGIAVWDVLEAAERPGSSDAAIVAATMRPNDIASLAGPRPLAAIALNGGTAARIFARCCRQRLADAGLFEGTRILRMPSTSSANATHSRLHKLTAWRQLAAVLQESSRQMPQR